MISKRTGAKKIHEVRKRDNRIVPFDENKIGDAISRALSAVGGSDRGLALELAAAVRHFLEERFSGTLPGIEDIQDQVENVLLEMGHMEAAKSFSLYRQKRSILRDTLEVRKVRPNHGEVVEEGELGGDRSGEEDEAGQALPTVDQGGGGVSRWQKSRIVSALIREGDLDAGVAAEVAGAVERKVLGSGISRISTSLLRELVDNELFERGLGAKLQQQVRIGLPSYNVRQFIFGTDVKEGVTFPKTPAEVRKAIANRILHQYSLQEVFSRPVAEAHQDGRIFIHRLSDPVRLASLTWSLPLPDNVRYPRGDDYVQQELPGLEDASGGRARARSSRPGPESFLDVGDFFRRLDELGPFFSEEILLVGISALLQDPTAAAQHSVERRMREVLERLAQTGADAPPVALDLDLRQGEIGWLIELGELSPAEAKRLRICLRLMPESFHRNDRTTQALLAAVARVYERGAKVEFLPAASERPRRTGFSAVMAKTTINLPRVAFRSARDDRVTIESELDAVVDLAIKGHLERREFIKQLGADRENPLWGVLGGTGQGADERAGRGPVACLDEGVFVVGVLGLNECIKFLTGKELHQNDVTRSLGHGILRRLAQKVRQESKRLGIRLVVEEARNVGPLRSLETKDQDKYPQMVAEIDRGRQYQWGRRYSDGVRFHRMAPLDPLRRVEELSPYLSYTEPAGGLVEDFRELRGAAQELLPSLLEESFAVLDAAGSASGVLAGASEAEGVTKR